MLKKISKMLLVVLMLLVMLPANIFAEEEITVTEDGTIISEVLTQKELIERYAEDMGFSYEEAKDALFPNSSSISPSGAKTYRTISKQLSFAHGLYKPYINFYCETTESQYHGGIVQVLNCNLNRTSGGKTRVYAGTIYYNLEDANRIYFTMDGDWYNTGSVSWSFGGSIGIGEFARVTASISNSGEYYWPCYVSDYVYWGA